MNHKDFHNNLSNIQINQLATSLIKIWWNINLIKISRRAWCEIKRICYANCLVLF